MKKIVLLSMMLLGIFRIHAQELYSGTWRMSTDPNTTSSPSIKLDIGTPERGQLYPARITIQCDSFIGVYHFVIVKKSTRQLVAGTTKYTVNETPFSLGNAPWFFNGTMDFFKDLKGQSHLSLNRIKARNPDFETRKPTNIKDLQLFNTLITTLQTSVLDFIKETDKPWSEESSRKILLSKTPPAYFGILDTVFVSSKFGSVKFGPNKDIDIISVGLNQGLIVDQVDSKKTREDEDFILDTGMNLLILFADDFGKKGNSTASISAMLDNTPRLLSFENAKDHPNAFIVMKIMNQYHESDETTFQNNPGFEDKFKELPIGNNSNDGFSKTMILNRPGKVIGSIASKSQTLTFALWDDAVEDGDSISLNINGRWIARGFPVKKQPQFITITLDPGPNVITFVADNLGSIVPNTSILEIIDGNRRKSFSIETDMNENNQVKIFYEVKPK